MVGHPKYTYGDILKFKSGNTEAVGYVYIIDLYGTLEQNNEVSYDIMGTDNNVLYKHITESEIIAHLGNIKD